MKNISWDDLRIFCHVAQTGGLSGAAQALSMSATTVGRRMLALEQAVGRTLFVRSQTGYQLSDDGRALLKKVLPMQASARPIAEWLAEDRVRPVVRISAGTWTANFLADNFMRLWRQADSFRIGFKATEARLDIAHREIEIGIRNQPPESGNLASRRLEELNFAPYRARNLPDPKPDEWIAVGSEEAATRSARWILAQDNLSICAWVSTPRLLRDVVKAGAGIGVMPCFIGDRDSGLERAGPIIDVLNEHQYLVTHNDDRHRPEVRMVIERIASLFASHRPLLRGDRPIENVSPLATDALDTGKYPMA
jgi:DNA-binding transcriptional LysR family regulator